VWLLDAGPRRQLAAYCSQGLGATTSDVTIFADLYGMFDEFYLVRQSDTT
jgi:hypothetical protein